MKTNLTRQPEVITRKQARKAHMEGLLQAATQEAIEASMNFRPGMTAWVYLMTLPGQKASYQVISSRFPEDRTETQNPRAGYQGGKLVWTPASAQARARS